jgi:hypothetical protein
MNKYRVLVEQEYTLRATSEYIVEAKSEEDIEKAIESGGIELKYTPISVTHETASYRDNLNLSANGYETLIEIEELEDEKDNT